MGEAYGRVKVGIVMPTENWRRVMGVWMRNEVSSMTRIE